MAEPGPEPEFDGEEALADADAASLALALGRAGRGNHAFDAKAAAFLDEQAGLIRLQKENLHEQRILQLAHLQVRRWKDRLSLALQLVGIVIGLAVATGLGVMVWQAHEDHGLVVQAFSVPPDLAQRGLTGQVVAEELLDKLQAMQAATDSARPAESYQNDWSSDLKVEIPDTGVSVGEVKRYLHQWLGHRTELSGEVTRSPEGLTVSARSGSEAAAAFAGKEVDLDALLQRAAEGIYRKTQPYRYAVWLQKQGRMDDSMAILTALAEGPAGPDRNWAGSVLANELLARGDVANALARSEDAVATAPDDAHVMEAGSGVQGTLGHDELALQLIKRGNRQLRLHPNAVTAVARTMVLANDAVTQLEARGDFLDAAAQSDRASRLPDYNDNVAFATAEPVFDLARAHDGAGADRAWRRAHRADVDWSTLTFDVLAADIALGRWADAVRAGAEMRAGVDKASGLSGGFLRVAMTRTESAYVAYAMAMSGDVAGAQALVAATPLDCLECVRMRGKIAAVAHDPAAAERWFSLAARTGPSFPFALTDLGALRLAAGDADGAIASLKEAHARGPRYADALELWGEALMRKGDIAGAVVKFREAAMGAPRWGRLHLMWGEALARSGDAAGARAQFQAAAGLEFSAADRAAVARSPGGRS